MAKFKIWAKAALIRALKTAAQVAVALIGTGVVAFGDVNWVYIASVAGVSAILSILTSVAGLPEVKAEEELAEIDIPRGQHVAD